MINCPFCNKGKEDFFLESVNFAAIYNISPILPGHSLIISKHHVESLFELSESELREFTVLGRNTAQFLSGIYNTKAFDWAIQEKEAAGQSVAHLHMHVVPRATGDLKDAGDWYQELEKSQSKSVDISGKFQLTEKQLKEITDHLKSAGKHFRPDFI